MKYTIIVVGCDDETAIDMELSDAEFEVVSRVAQEITKKSSYSCQPTMKILKEKE